MSQIAAIDIANAPRDLQELIRKGRFQIRALAQELKIIETLENKTAFMAMGTEAQAQQVLTALKALDGKGTNGAASNGAAAAPTESKLKRNPSNKGLNTQAAEAQVAPAAASGMPVSIAPLMEAIGALNKRLDVVVSNQGAILELLEGLKGLVATSTATTLLVGETTLNASKDDILSAALEDVAQVQAQVTAALGKATS